jgi:hypothetical protein
MYTPEITAGELGRQAREQEQRVEERVRGPGGVVVDREDPVEPALVSGTGHGAGELERLGAVHVTRIHRPDVDTKLHAYLLQSECQTFEVANGTTLGLLTPAVT